MIQKLLQGHPVVIQKLPQGHPALIQRLLRAHQGLRRRANSLQLSGLLLAACSAHSARSVSAVPQRFTAETDFVPPEALAPRVSAALLVRPSEALAESQLGWVTLREPLPKSAAVATVRRLCAAIAAESSDALAQLLAPDAWLEVQGERRPALTTWTSRFARLPYQSVPCEQAMDLSHISLLSPLDPELLGEARQLGEGSEFVATVPVLRAQLNGERLFGTSLFVGLQRVADEYRITSMLDP